MPKDWLLKRGQVVLGHLSGCSLDQPFFVCRFAPTPAFEEIRSLFEAELKLLNAGQMDQWTDAYTAIEALGLQLQSADGEVVSEFLLHVDECGAWFRY